MQPHRRQPCKSTRYNQPWANGKNRNLSPMKKQYFKKAQRTKCAHDQTTYREIKKLAQSECTKAYYENINSMLDQNNQNEVNLKKFWSFIKSKKKETSGVAALMKDGTVHSDSQAILSLSREKHQICGECAATGCKLREERLPSTQQCDHHAGKLELGVRCEQAGGSQVRNVVSHYKQLSRRNNIRTHIRSYTHQRQHTPLLTTIHTHRSLQTLLLFKHHQIMEQMHTTIS